MNIHFLSSVLASCNNLIPLLNTDTDTNLIKLKQFIRAEMENTSTKEIDDNINEKQNEFKKFFHLLPISIVDDFALWILIGKKYSGKTIIDSI